MLPLDASDDGQLSEYCVQTKDYVISVKARDFSWEWLAEEARKT